MLFLVEYVEPLLLGGEVDEDLLVEAAEDGGVQAPRQVRRRQEQDRAGVLDNGDTRCMFV